MKAEAYLSRGVSPTKEDVKKAVSGQSAGLYPGSFCKIIPDLAQDPAWCTVIHADGAGTKSAAAYLMFRETGDPSWFTGIAQDSLIMNTDDLLCVGAVGGFKISNTIGRNAHRVDTSCLKAIIGGYDRIIEDLRQMGIDLEMTGGETADVGDLVRTVICDSTVVVRLPRSQVIQASAIRPGQAIVGLASFGQTSYERRENSGIGSNGLTAARHLLLHGDYLLRYPESCSDTLPEGKAYCGNWHLQDPLPGSQLSVGEAILSPTRTYLPVIRAILPAVGGQISGVIHCTGGGQIKCRDFGRGIRYVKDNLFPAPPIFRAIAQSQEVGAAEMYQIFNMGHRLEIYCDESAAETIIGICGRFNLEARKVGHTEASSAGHINEVLIRDQGQEYFY
ncbi:MAG TPA: phosphoribosylformylglycinamidine cyclo-ligase [Clostridiales bacterium]|nr:phosphoribosylformylglycinamidine cyclo-ligase [Clostridiales bacterium]